MKNQDKGRNVVKKTAVKSKSPKKTTVVKTAAKTKKTIAKKNSVKSNLKIVKTSTKVSKKPNILKGVDPKIAEFFNSIPEKVRERFHQIITKQTDILKFGPLKGSTFSKMLKSTEHLSFYRDKFFLASKNAKFVRKVATVFNPNLEELYGPDFDLPGQDIGIRIEQTEE